MGCTATGWPEFDREFGGLPRPGVVAVDGSDTCGRGMLIDLLVLARAAVGCASAVFTVATPPEKVYRERLACMHAGIELIEYWTHVRESPNGLSSYCRRRPLADAEAQAFHSSLTALGNNAVFIDNEFPISVAGIKATIESTARTRRIELAAVLWPELIDEAPELPGRDYYCELIPMLHSAAVDTDSTIVVPSGHSGLTGSSLEIAGRRDAEGALELITMAGGRQVACRAELPSGVRAFLALPDRNGNWPMRMEDDHADYF